MTKLPTISAKATRLINAWANAAAELSWMGSAHPDTWDGIKEDHAKARHALRQYIHELEQRR